MKHVLTPPGLQALHELLTARPILVFDFDGTLSPIVANPDAARASLPVSRVLGQLSERFPVAIVTGRSVADVTPRLGFSPYMVVGNHGAEDPQVPTGSDPAALDTVRALLATGWQQRLTAAGARVEDKGHSMALHYRLSRDRDGSRETIDALVAMLGPEVECFEGKMVVNVVPRGAPNKADAVYSLMRRSGADRVLFAGDDVNDEPVFEQARPDWVTVKVGRDQRHSCAAFFVSSTAEMAIFLEECLRLSAATPSAWD